jgi:SAM-dependent methyltransferase
MYGSGAGSLLFHNLGYIAFIEGFIANHTVRSVVDMGCGDWQFSQYINWGQTRYRGYDIIQQVVEANQRQYTDDAIDFHLYSGDADELPQAELLIIKDVLHHLSHRRIKDVLSSIRRFRYALITNSLDPRGDTHNTDIADGGFRYLDVRNPPFNVTAEEVFEFKKRRAGEDGTFELDPNFRKIRLLITN